MNHQILQLQPPIPVVTPMGDAIAHLVIDYSIEHSIHWVVFMEDTGQCWTLPNEQIRAQRNITLGRYNPCLLYTSPSPRDRTRSRMPSSA